MDEDQLPDPNQDGQAQAGGDGRKRNRNEVWSVAI